LTSIVNLFQRLGEVEWNKVENRIKGIDNRSAERRKTSRCVEDILEEGAWKKGLHPESEELSKVFNKLIKENKVVVHILWDGYDYHLHFGPAK